MRVKILQNMAHEYEAQFASNPPIATKEALAGFLKLCTQACKEGQASHPNRSLVNRGVLRGFSSALGVSTKDLVILLNQVFTSTPIVFELCLPDSIVESAPAELPPLVPGVWTPFNHHFRYHPDHPNAFVGSAYDRPGVLIEFHDGTRWLCGDFCKDGVVGDKNNDGMSDTLGVMFDQEPIVTRVKLLDLT